MFTTKFKTILSIVTLGIGLVAKAQSTVDFENTTLNGQGYYNGSDLSGGYSSNGLHFKNDYTPQFQSWSGFAASSVTDSATAGYTNQYGCYAGGAANGSQKFGLAYVFTFPTLRSDIVDATTKLVSFQYTNNTYAGLSMKNGDAVAKKFGGVSGNDPDFFKLLVYNYWNGVVTDTGEVYLADYRSADNSQDFIAKAWRTATFNFSSPFDSLVFDLKSTDNGTFGMNTPAYFCLDNLTYELTTGLNQTLKPGVSFHPNPARNAMTVKGIQPGELLEILDPLGRVVESTYQTNSESITLNVSPLKSGMYLVRSQAGVLGRFIKE